VISYALDSSVSTLQKQPGATVVCAQPQEVTRAHIQEKGNIQQKCGDVIIRAYKKE
jgi:hypothetical protein